MRRLRSPARVIHISILSTVQHGFTRNQHSSLILSEVNEIYFTEDNEGELSRFQRTIKNNLGLKIICNSL